MRFIRRRGEPPDALDVDTLRACLSEFPLSLAVVFGSRAGGGATDLSDLDVAVQFEADVADARRADLADEMMAEITRRTGFEAVDLVDLSAVGPRVGYEALSTGVLVLGDPADAVELESRFLQRKLDFQPVVDEWQAALEDRLAEGSYGRP